MLRVDRSFYSSGIPSTAQQLTRPNLNAIAYVWQDERRAYVMAFHGKAAKYDEYYSYRTIDQAITEANKYLDGQVARQKMVDDRKTERKNYQHDYKPGDIIHFSWGYDQTNCQFFQVISAPTPKSVVIREIAGDMVEHYRDDCGKAVPTPNKFIGEPMTKRVQPGGYVSLASYGCASKWDGRPCYVSWYA